MFDNGYSIGQYDHLSRLYHYDLPEFKADDTKFKHNTVLTATFQITDDCCCKCSYCYQPNKGHRMMEDSTIEKCVDMLFDIYYDDNDHLIEKDYNVGIILEFIGGEPLMNIPAMDKCCSYFFEKAISLHHPWAITWMGSMISNGAYYFKKEFQDFLAKFGDHIFFNVTIDGPKEMHDTCRVYHDGRGNFDDAWKALTTHIATHRVKRPLTKVTISQDNLTQVHKILEFFINNNINTIYANPLYEHKWTEEEGSLYYNELKKIADFLLGLPKETDYWFSIFNDNSYHALKEEHLDSWCGGDGRMIAFDPEGNIYPCLRYMDSSLNGEREPIIIGHCDSGIGVTEKQKQFRKILQDANRRTESTDECFNCPIVSGCGTCLAWAYQETGELGKRSPNACNMHKAASLAACYFWNKYYKQNNIDKTFHRFLPDEEALKFISKEELDMLDSLEQNKSIK